MKGKCPNPLDDGGAYIFLLYNPKRIYVKNIYFQYNMIKEFIFTLSYLFIILLVNFFLIKLILRIQIKLKFLIKSTKILRINKKEIQNTLFSYFQFKTLKRNLQKRHYILNIKIVLVKNFQNLYSLKTF